MTLSAFRDEKDKAASSRGCLVTIFLTVVLFFAGILGLACFCTSHPGQLLRNVYPYMVPFVAGTADDRAAFSNAYMEIARRLDSNPMFLTNGVLVALSQSARKKRITPEDTANMERALGLNKDRAGDGNGQ